MKHMLSAVYGRIKIKPLFDYAFVPGSLQKTFAQKLAFPIEGIITGAYSCDVNTFRRKLLKNANNEQKDSHEGLSILVGIQKKNSFRNCGLPSLNFTHKAESNGNCIVQVRVDYGSKEINQTT